MKLDKERYAELKKMAKDYGVYVATRELNESGGRYNGVSVAFAPMLDNGRGKMLSVSVSYCASADQYSKKVGKCAALEKWFDGESIQMPLAKDLKNVGVNTVANNLLEIFSYI